jgi:hypothetical protein
MMVIVAVGVAVISGEGTGCSVTASSTPSLPSFPFPLAAPFPLWCFLEEPAARCFRAFSSKTSSSVASARFLQHPCCVVPPREPGFSTPSWCQ